MGRVIGFDKGTRTTSKVINEKLEDIEYLLKDHYNEFLLRRIPLSSERVINAYFGNGMKEITLIKYSKKLLQEMEKRIDIERGYITHSRYVRTVNLLEDYIWVITKKKDEETKIEGKEYDIPIRMLTPDFVIGFDNYLRNLKDEEGKDLLAHNQVLKYVQRFKYFFKEAKYEYDKESNYNFPDSFIK
ncbi:MAG: phage integrase SAM-like domain-containing protein, partial [Bacteroides sp.]|nr:phage integrase SAM-like domain-containing protein [Bacteroides sp.]